MASNPQPINREANTWGRVIVVCGLFNHMCTIGMMLALSVLYVSWLDQFQEGKGTTSWVLSIGVACMFGLCPIPANLATRFSFRVIGVVGAITTCGGLVLASFATSVTYLVITIGLITGVGCCFCYLPAVAVVALYFDKRRSLAMGISTAGTGVGAFTLAPLMNLLEETYGWRGALLIMGGITLNMCVTGLLLRPFQETETTTIVTMSDDEDDEEEIEIDEKGSIENQGMLMLGHERKNKNGEILVNDDGDTFEKEKADPFARSVISVKDDVNYSKSLDLKPGVLDESSSLVLLSNFRHQASMDSTSDMEVAVSSCVEVKGSHGEIKKAQTSPPGPLPKHCKHPFPNCPCNQHRLHVSLCDVRTKPILHNKNHHHHSVQVLNFKNKDKHINSKSFLRSIQNVDMALLASRYISQILMQTNNNSRNISQTSLIVKVEANGKESAPHLNGGDKNQSICSRIFSSPAVKANLDLLKDKVFLIFAISNFITNLSYISPVVYMVDRAIDNGIDKSTAAIFVSANGVGNIVGRLFFGYISDGVCSNRMFLQFMVLMVCGAGTILSTFSGSIAVLHVAYAVFYGILMGAYTVLAPLVTVDLMGVANVTTAYGLVLFFMGPATIIGPPLAGWLFDWTQSYVLSYAIIGVFFIVSGLMLLPLVIIARRRRQLAIQADEGAFADN